MTKLPTQPNKRDIMQQLHEMVDHHLFESTTWPADRESVVGFNRFLEQMALTERVAGTDNTFRFTVLGRDCGLPLAHYLIGAHEPTEIPESLQYLGLIDEDEAESAYSLLEGPDFLKCVEKLVRRAYFRTFGRSILH